MTTATTNRADPAGPERHDWPREAQPLLDLLTEVCAAHAPPGVERELGAIITRHLAPLAVRVWQDAAGNTVALLPGHAHDKPLQLTAHKDEIALIVKRIDPDGRLAVDRLGGIYPFKVGEGPVDILADDGSIVPASLGFGAVHVSAVSSIQDVKSGRRAAQWSDAVVDAKLTREELHARGVHVGSRIVLDRTRKSPRVLQDYVGAHALDDRGGIALLLLLAESLAAEPPPQDVYFLLTSGEEVESGAAVYGSRELPGDTLVAVEVAPVMPEYNLRNDARPVVIWADGRGPYDAALTTNIVDAARDRGIEVQAAVLASFGSDAALARRMGAIARSACVGFPTENTHGYEVAHLGGMLNCGRLLEALVRAWPL